MRLTREGLLTAVLVVAALFVGSSLTERLPQPSAVLEAPFLHAGAVGDTIALRTADVTVHGITGSPLVRSFSDTAQTPGVFLVAEIEWAPRGQASMLSGAVPEVVAADGRVFGGFQAVSNNCGPAQPGLPVRCQLAFEVATDAAAGAHLLIPAGPTTGTADDVADIDLGITPEQAARFAASGTVIPLKQSVVEP